MFKIHDRETHLSQSQLTKLSPMNVELKLAMKLIIMEKVNDWDVEKQKKQRWQRRGECLRREKSNKSEKIIENMGKITGELETMGKATKGKANQDFLIT